VTDIGRIIGSEEFEVFRIFSVQGDGDYRKSLIYGGRYWDRTGGPCRVKRGVGAYRSTICEPGYQLQQALGIT
jgi:hypothetical protein